MPRYYLRRRVKFTTRRALRIFSSRLHEIEDNSVRDTAGVINEEVLSVVCSLGRYVARRSQARFLEFYPPVYKL